MMLLVKAAAVLGLVGCAHGLSRQAQSTAWAQQACANIAELALVVASEVVGEAQATRLQASTVNVVLPTAGWKLGSGQPASLAAYHGVMRLAMVGALTATTTSGKPLGYTSGGALTMQAVSVLAKPFNSASKAFPLIEPFATQYTTDALSEQWATVPGLTGLGGGSGTGFEIYCDNTALGGGMDKLFEAGGGYGGGGSYGAKSAAQVGGGGGAGAEVVNAAGAELHFGAGCATNTGKCSADPNNVAQSARAEQYTTVATRASECTGTLFVTGGGGGGGGADSVSSTGTMQFSWGCNFLHAASKSYVPKYPSITTTACDPGQVLGVAYQMLGNGTLPAPIGCTGFIQCQCIPAQQYALGQLSNRCKRTSSAAFLTTMCDVKTDSLAIEQSSSLRAHVRGVLAAV
jgi:hypothetical protein